MLLNEDPKGYRGDRGVRGAWGGAGGAMRMTGLGLVGERYGNLKVNVPEVLQCKGTIYKEDEISGKAWTWAAWRPCLGTLHLDEQQFTGQKEDKSK